MFKKWLIISYHTSGHSCYEYVIVTGEGHIQGYTIYFKVLCFSLDMAQVICMGKQKEVCLFHIYLTIFFLFYHGKFVSLNEYMITNVHLLNIDFLQYIDDCKNELRYLIYLCAILK